MIIWLPNAQYIGILLLCSKPTGFIVAIAPVHVCTLKSAYNEKKYAEILLCYRWLFVKGNIFIGEWGIWCEYFPSL